ncbi:hypothetical protein E3N88_26752 [Mikania micrantha]|uniref:Delta(3)-Delta(2)-enoyl-CoA isomerase n=1 Tax=Mikania micrantha TaxID=192012 RepID=A0A5N6MVD8_9ASTR|nr:hypothetical protein E3N88_26752 [Mikania micrantha]
MLPKCDVVVINMPLTEKTKGMFDKERIAKMKKGVLIVNNARGAIMDTQAVADGCSRGHIAGKFFSNGFDLAWAKSASGGSPSEAIKLLRHMVTLFKDVVADLISLPMPTIAAVTGHAAAAGLLLAMSHDYVLMRRDRGVLYMSEVDIGMTLPDYFTAAIRSKVARPEVRRDVLLRGVKFKAEDAVVKGLIDSAHDNGEKAVEAAVRLGEELTKRRWDGEVYAEIRKSLYPELIGVLGLTAKAVVKARM